MLVIRLFRVGKKNQPSFKIVVTDKRKPPRAGRFLEELGNWNPLKKEKTLKGDRIKYWLSVGAKPSPTIFNLLVSEKIIEGKKIDVHKKPKRKEEAASLPAEALAKAGAGATASQEAASAPAGATASQEGKKEEVAKESPKEEKPTPEKTAEEKIEEPKTEEKPKENPPAGGPKDYNPPTASSHSPEGERAPEKKEEIAKEPPEKEAKSEEAK